jgi:hypothetical protein
MQALIQEIGRVPCQRTTLYGEAPAQRISASFLAGPLEMTVNRPPRRRERPKDRSLVRFG